MSLGVLYQVNTCIDKQWRGCCHVASCLGTGWSVMGFSPLAVRYSLVGIMTCTLVWLVLRRAYR